jgi:hypothetical protein
MVTWVVVAFVATVAFAFVVVEVTFRLFSR